jgi:hypothetical protein
LEIFESKKVTGTETDYQKIIELYHGNPKALEIVSAHIKDLYAGNINDYLTELNLKTETILFDDIKHDYLYILRVALLLFQL